LKDIGLAGVEIKIDRGQDAMGDEGGMTTERVMVVKPIHFVLVHGISGGAWCWYKIRCLMENSGYRVSCIDLKSCGIDQTDPTSIISFDDYNKPLLDFMSNLPDDDQVLLNYLH
jgi:pimeloyl-ACP methyl ester carboxylesterase